MRDICILATGGTIDKEHDPITESLIFSENTNLHDILDQCRVPDIEHRVLMLKDSIDMTDLDRELIKDEIQQRSEQGIIVTHGTSTMTDTAEFLQSEVKDKAVILTGALRPFTLFMSDAAFNLGGAIALARTIDPGVYIYMNGRVFEAGSVQKNTKTGVFERI